MFPNQLIDTKTNEGEQIDKLKVGINDAMRKLNRILNNNQTIGSMEVTLPFKQKIRIFQDENFYYKITLNGEVRTLSLNLNLEEGQCNFYVSFKNEFPTKVMHDFELKKANNLIFASSFKGPVIYLCI